MYSTYRETKEHYTLKITPSFIRRLISISKGIFQVSHGGKGPRTWSYPLLLSQITGRDLGRARRSQDSKHCQMWPQCCRRRLSLLCGGACPSCSTFHLAPCYCTWESTRAVPSAWPLQPLGNLEEAPESWPGTGPGLAVLAVSRFLNHPGEGR